MKRRVTAQELADYVRGVASSEMATRIADEIERSENLAQRERAMRAFLGRASDVLEPSVPEDWILRAKALVPEVNKPTLREVLVTLLFDNRTRPAFGVRSAIASTHELSFEADGFEVALRIEPLGKKQSTLIGQISCSDPGQDPPRGVVSLLQGNRPVAGTELSEFGEFVLECPMAASVQLSIALANYGIQLRIPLSGYLA